MYKKKGIKRETQIVNQLPREIYAYLDSHIEFEEDECECKEASCKDCFPPDPEFEVETTERLKDVPVGVEVGVYKLVDTGEMKKTFSKTLSFRQRPKGGK